jgi:ABC-type nitrate/sulfonate/bicarbonate transport system substrate-binding protein
VAMWLAIASMEEVLMRKTTLRHSRTTKLREVIIALTALACVYLTKVPCAAAQTLTILVGSDPYYLPIFLADANGYFRDQGLSVSVKMFPSGTDAMLAFRGIGAEFLAAGDAPSLILWSGGDAVGVAPIYESPDNLFGVVQSNIQKAADLKGKTIATRKASTADYFLTTYLKLNDVAPSEVHVVNLSPEECAPAMLSGDIGGFFLWRPYPSLALRMMGDKAHILTTARGVYMEQIFLSANRKFAEANPGTVSKFIMAVKTAIDFVGAEPARSADIVAKRIKANADLVTPVIETKPYTMSYGGQSQGQLKKLVEFLVENQKIKSPLDVVTSVDPSYLKAVDATLVDSH